MMPPCLLERPPEYCPQQRRAVVSTRMDASDHHETLLDVDCAFLSISTVLPPQTHVCFQHLACYAAGNAGRGAASRAARD